ncbi:BnaC02g09350D [Brassica napus]|uniref:BnaC02g09350D protein n=1 Tax=Brassica napus TaxID=3708 RepID=A0A078HDZ7_BRANA|nr:BnaC02g09350D [Brassica napus]
MFLYMANNMLKGEVPKWLWSIANSGVIDLAHNNFSGSVPRCLINSTVEYLDLRNNNLIGKLPDIFDTRSSLIRILDVSHNQIAGKLPMSLTNCTNLEVINVESNRIVDLFPFWLKDLPKLKVVVLRSNMFHGPIYSHQHPLSFPQLRMVDISRNKFTGRLPHDYFVTWSTPHESMIGTPREAREPLYIGDDYSYRKDSRIYYNDFTGHIPSSWANLTRLESLDLSGNQLSGKIPHELASLSFLEYINVSHNKLSGQIPQSTQLGGQPKSSFEGNLNLCGLPLQESCFRYHTPSAPEEHHLKPPKREQVLNWKAVAMGYGPGVLFGLVIGQVLYSYKPVLFYKLFRL